jgi:hypothetical protein
MPYIGTQPKDVRSFGRAKFDFTATQGQTAFTGADDDSKTLGFTDGQIEVYVNGILMDDSDFTTSNGNTVTLASAANLNDIISIVALQTDIPNSDYVPASGGTFTGAITVDGAFTSKGIDDNADATSITIDNNETVMVGKTVSDGATTGHELRPSSFAVHTVDGGAALYARRIGSGTNDDGDIAVFQNANGNVGSIGSYSDDMTIGTGDTRVRFIDSLDCVVPVSNAIGTSRDNAVDLGFSSVRFKDLYLGGGVYLGGTGAANHLDDYEEGTWTPVILGSSSNPTVSYSTQLGTYRKVGKLLYLNMYLYASGLSGGSGYIEIGGLPFGINGAGTGGYPFIGAGYHYLGNASAAGVNANNVIRWQANASPVTKLAWYGSGGNSWYTGAYEISATGTLPVL